jgi:hypothetical protein
MKSLAYVVASTIVVGACTPPFPGTVTELGSDELAEYSAAALDVSDSGRIVGYYGGGSDRAVEFQDGGAAVFMPPPTGYSNCRAVAVASDGRIAGWCNRGWPRSTAVFAPSAEAPFELLTPADGVESGALDMNERGVILGVRNTPGMTDHAPWIYDTNTGTLTVLPGLPDARMSASAINDAGDIVGEASTVGSDGIRVAQGVKWSGDSLTITILPLVPTDINNRGDIIGNRRTGTLERSTALYLPAGSAVPQALQAPVLRPGDQIAGVQATDLNDEGFIIGVASYWAFGNDVTTSLGVAWTPEGRVIDFGTNTAPYAVNASRVIVGARSTGGRAARAVRIDLPADSP